MDSTEMQVIVKECNFIIIVINDILSLKKELVSSLPQARNHMFLVTS